MLTSQDLEQLSEIFSTVFNEISIRMQELLRISDEIDKMVSEEMSLKDFLSKLNGNHFFLLVFKNFEYFRLIFLEELHCMSILQERGPPIMIIIKHRGNFNNTEKFFKGVKKMKLKTVLNLYGQQGVIALAAATPQDTGLTSQSWDYNIQITSSGYQINWTNSNVVNGVPIAIILQYGHGTRRGGYVQGRDYINPAIRPVMDRLAESLWREVISL